MAMYTGPTAMLFRAPIFMVSAACTEMKQEPSKMVAATIFTAARRKRRMTNCSLPIMVISPLRLRLTNRRSITVPRSQQPLTDFLTQIAVVRCHDAPLFRPTSDHPCEESLARRSWGTVGIAIARDRPLQMYQGNVVAQQRGRVCDVCPNALAHLKPMNLGVVVSKL